MRVLFLTNIPSPYRVNFFNCLGELCDLTVLFERESSSERDESWKNFSADKFRYRVLKGIKLGVAEAFCPGVKKHLKKNDYDAVIISNYTTPTGWLALRYLKKKKIPFFIEGDGGIAKSGKGFKERLKRRLLRGATGYFSTGKEHDNYYITYGVPEDKIYRYPFTSIAQKDILKEPIREETKIKLKEDLGIEEEKMILAVGQFIHRKGFDVLLSSAKALSKDIGVYFVGGKPTEEYVQFCENNGLNNIHFIGFKKTAELKKYYCAADVFVHPTREDIWGLVINEAMAQGLPVVTTDKCVAGLELVKNGKNGYLVPVEDEQALTQAIIKVLGDDRITMARESLKEIQGYTFEEMAKRHIEVLSQCVK